MEIKKVLNSKATKIAAWIILPTVLVGGFFAVKYIIDYKERKRLNELREKYKNINSMTDFYEGLKYIKQPTQYGYDLSKLIDKKDKLDAMDFEELKKIYGLLTLTLAERTEEENQTILNFLSKIYS